MQPIKLLLSTFVRLFNNIDISKFKCFNSIKTRNACEQAMMFTISNQNT